MGCGTIFLEVTSTFHPVPRWTVFPGLLGALALIALASWLWVRSVADRRWATMEKQVEKLLAEARARDARRPVLYGEPTPGDAWDFYGRALNGLPERQDAYALRQF